MHWTGCLLLLLIKPHVYYAFLSPTSTVVSEISCEIRKVKCLESALFAAPSNENLLRQDIEKKSSLVTAKDEINYSATINEGADGDIKVGTSTLQDESNKLAKKIERALKPRAYPLFIAEKAAIFLDELLKPINGREGVSAITIDGTSPKKEKIVVLGTGWGAASFLKEIDSSKFDVTVISPRNFFLFTPMLAGASVGTVEFRSITEPVRELNTNANYLEGTATDIDMVNNVVYCDSVICEGNSCEIEEFTVDFDKLIVTVGAQTNTYGIPGVRDHCCFLKQVEDARRIRTSIINCFERANLPSLSEEQRIAILTFAVIGAGPTGVEFASELRDFIEEDGPKYYPKLLKYVRIKVIEASPTVLAPFDKSLQTEAIAQLTRQIKTKDASVLNLLPEQFQLTELLLNSGVSEVKENSICLNDGTEIPYGLSVWAAGNGPLPITLGLIEKLGEGDQAEAQTAARGRLATDAWLRVLGSEGKIMSFGDCACITSGQLPATAQVASQQGEYLARLLSQDYNMYPGKESGIDIPPIPNPSSERTLAENIAAFACQASDIAAPFQFLNLGILAYTGGNTALAQLQVTPAEQGRLKGKGKLGFGLWRSVYLSKQVSWRNRFLVFTDWIKAQLFGRDITRL